MVALSSLIWSLIDGGPPSGPFYETNPRRVVDALDVCSWLLVRSWLMFSLVNPCGFNPTHSNISYAQAADTVPQELQRFSAHSLPLPGCPA